MDRAQDSGTTSHYSILPDIPRFPPELLVIIFAAIPSSPSTPLARGRPEHKAALASLANCARVCRLWYPHALQALYSLPGLVEEELAAFASTIASSPSHAALVKSLDVIPPRRELSSLIELIHGCPNLRQLSISKPLSEMALDPASIALLAEGPPIESFRIHAPASLVINFISSWSSLRFLDVSTRGPTNTVLDLPPPRFKLYEMRWNVDLLVEKDLIDAEWTLSNSFESINILQFRKAITPAFFDRLISHPGSTLRSLRFVYFPTNYLPFLPLCTQLEELSVLDFLQVDLLNALPPNLEHLEFVTAHSNFPIDAFRKFLMFHGKMKALTIHEMKFLCEEHKELLKELIVEYDLDTLVCEWPVWVLYEDEEMTPVAKFPRNSLQGDLNAYEILHRRRGDGRF